MIKNDRQYRITRAHATNFENALKELSRVTLADRERDPLRFQIQEDALSGQLNDLRVELHEYEALRANPGVIQAESLDDLPRALIAARIAAGLSQQELAARLGIKEQQIQRYESTEYLGASIDRIREVCRALGVEVRHELLLPTAPLSVGRIYRKAHALGLDRKFIDERIMPDSLKTQVQVSASGPQDHLTALRLATAIGRIFNWTPGDFASEAPLTLDNAVLSATRYKRPAARATARTTVYTVYAHYIALLVLQCASPPRDSRREAEPARIHAHVSGPDGSVTLLHLLEFLWNFGVPVLPLPDVGAFHGAWWRIDGQDIVAVKQRTTSAARWIVDVLHEYRHVLDADDTTDAAILEDCDVLAGGTQSAVEERATDFAIDVALAGRQEELAQACVRAAHGKVEWLKRVVPQVATAERVDVGLLANYLAYRLSYQEINWWPTAQGLQPGNEDPWTTAADFLWRHIDIERLAIPDQELLRKALSKG